MKFKGGNFMSLLLVGRNPRNIARRFKKFISRELSIPRYMISQEIINVHTDKYLLIHKIVRHDRGLRVEADIMMTFNADSIVDKLKSIMNPDSMCFGTVRLFTLIDREWKILSEYHIDEKPLSEINDKINDHARMLKSQDVRFYSEYAC